MLPGLLPLLGAGRQLTGVIGRARLAAAVSQAASAVGCYRPPAASHRWFAQASLAEASESQGLSELEVRPLPASFRRTGAIAVKVGMTQEWDQWGVRLPLTVLWVDSCEVVQAKQPDKHGFAALQLGCGSKRAKQVNGRQLGHYQTAGVGIKRKLAEFRVSPEALLPTGTCITAAHFVAGQYVDVTGTTIGKGFQGPMKRWGFAGQPASHGNSKAHRSMGSIGACQDPGKVAKGKKMAGRMGGVRRTTQCVWVYKVDPGRGLLYVKGQVPGHKGNYVLLKDAVFKTAQEQPERPFPTWLEQQLPSTSVAAAATADPFEYRDQ